MRWELAVVTIDCSTSFMMSLFFGIESRTRSFFRGRLHDETNVRGSNREGNTIATVGLTILRKG